VTAFFSPCPSNWLFVYLRLYQLIKSANERLCGGERRQSQRGDNYTSFICTLIAIKCVMRVASREGQSPCVFSTCCSLTLRVCVCLFIGLIKIRRLSQINKISHVCAEGHLYIYKNRVCYLRNEPLEFPRTELFEI